MPNLPRIEYSKRPDGKWNVWREVETWTNGFSRYWMLIDVRKPITETEETK